MTHLKVFVTLGQLEPWRMFSELLAGGRGRREKEAGGEERAKGLASRPRIQGVRDCVRRAGGRRN